MTRSDRLISLMLTDTGSATRLRFPSMDEEQTRQAVEQWASAFEVATHEQVVAGAKVNPGPFLFRMAQLPDSERMYAVWERILRRGDLKVIARFLRSFYTDPDPHVEGLRQIECPTLVLLGEHDVVFLEASELMAREIPHARHVVMEGVGHMTAIEDTERMVQEILDFLDSVATTGKANR